MKLDLGSGPTPQHDHLGVDVFERPPVVGQHHGVINFRFSLVGERWPFESESAEALYSSHLIEHLPAANTFYHKDVLARFFEEAWRVAKMGALFTLRWPALVDERTGKWLPSAFFDPTHRRFIPREQLLYFSAQGRREMGVEQYGFECNWTIVEMAQRALTTDESVIEYIAVLRKAPLE